MRQLCVLIVVLFVGAGCASEGQKSVWDPFLKDLRGDNMEMRGFGNSKDAKD